MSKPRHARNILFIMCDQLRWDYLSCYGHPKLHTPNIDALAARGVRFTRAYVQSPVCGASRMSFYTGRYVQSHGAAWNGYPLKVGEMTLGDYLRPLGVQTVLVGKTHMRADTEGMQRLGIDPNSIIGVRVSECGFDPYERDDGLHAVGPEGRYDPQSPRYNRYLNDKGYVGDNPWHDWANAAQGEGNALASGWAMRHARKPARVKEEDCRDPLHDAPRHGFHRRGRRGALVPAPLLHQAALALRRARSLQQHVRARGRDPRGALRGGAARSASRLSRLHGASASRGTFARDEVRAEVIPVYMGLIKQIDDQLGRLLAFMQERGLLENTLIVFTSDHGDYLGDHWMGEKDLFHEPSVKVPLIVYDPSPAADAARGTVCDELVEAIDLAPTFLEVLGGDPCRAIAPPGGSLAGAFPAWPRAGRLAQLRHQRVRLCPPRGSQARRRAARRAPLHGRRQALEVHPCDRLPADALRSGERPSKNSATSAPIPPSSRSASVLAAALAQWGLRLSQRTTLSEAPGPDACAAGRSAAVS